MDWLKEESGQGMVEYALILAFIAIAAVAALEIFGVSLGGKYEEIAQAMP